MEKLMNRNVLKTLGSIRVALAVAVGLPLLIVSNAFAQEPAAGATPTTGTNIPPAGGAATGGQAEVERVIVTGSNIPTAEEVGPNPVDTYRRDDITRLGVRSSTDLVFRLPAATGSTINENNTNGGDGRAEINLRGILAKETLVLIDGRRLAPVGFAGQTVDINTFPVGLIDHIDILKDGASAVYGADAVSGVFNVWFTHRYRGVEVYASAGNSNLGFAGDAAEYRTYVLAGTGDDKTDLVVFAEWYSRAAIYSRDIDIGHDADHSDWGGLAIPRAFGGGFLIDGRSGNFAGRVNRYLYDRSLNGGALTPPPFSQVDPNSLAAPRPNIVGVYRNRSTFTREDQLFNFADITPALATVDREHLYGSFTRDICDKYLTVFADFKYARTFFDGALAPTPFLPDVWTDFSVGGLDPTHNKAFGISSNSISVPTQNPFNPFTNTEYVAVGGSDPRFPQTKDSQAPAGQAFITGVRYRSLEAGLRTDKITSDNYMFTAGLKGELGEFGDYLKTWNWETGFRFNEDHRLERFGGIVNNNALRAALLDTDPATAFNPFGYSSNTKAAIDRVFVTTNHVGATFLELEDLKLNGDLFSIPGGPVSFAVGGEHRREHASDNPDALTASGQTTGATNFAPTKGSRDVWSTFWELRVPVTSPTWNFPGLYSLELDYQERYDNFSDFGDTQRPKISARWQPLDSAWTVRATYNEAFHAPTLGELFGGKAQSFPLINDPLGFTTDPQAQATFSGNPNLKPETAYEWTYGTIITPGKWWGALQGLTVSADFYHIDLRSIAVALDPQVIVNENASSGGLLFPNQVQRDGTGAILNIDSPIQNLGRFIQEGIDYEMVYIFETSRLGHGDWGTLTTTFNGTYIDRAVIQLIPGGPETIAVGKFGGGFLGTTSGGSLTHNRWYASLFYDKDGLWGGQLDTGATVHYIGQYWDGKASTAFILEPVDRPANKGGPGLPQGFNDRKVREWITLDYILNYTFNFPAPTAETEVAGYAKDGGKVGKTKDGKDKNVMPVSTAEYNPCGWRAWLNNTTVTLGMNNVFDEQPPFVAAAFENGYDESTANPKGRFWYVGVKKKF
jgi:iron complex outermembrane receptor protein